MLTRICEYAEELTSVGGVLSWDSIDTASRIQSFTSEMGVAVRLGTYDHRRGVRSHEARACNPRQPDFTNCLPSATPVNLRITR